MKKSLLIFLFIMSTQANANNLKYQKAILAGGCFWGVEELFQKQEGVVETNVGYAGGEIPNPTYKIISTGLTNYAESIEITFDPKKTSYEKLLKFFFTIHDPTTLNRQQNDIGSQYRSAIFYVNDEQKNIASNVIKQANHSGVFKKIVVTTLEKAGKFYLAEDYHQDYLEKNPYGYTCHHVRNEWKF
ncbi:MAG: methionine-S-sulfoxide reductase [Lentimonas sp.]|jgi:methionine-S-sulfoxide reductase